MNHQRNRALRHITAPTGAHILTTGRDRHGRFARYDGTAHGALYVTVSRRGHWRRWDDARMANGDAVCRGCGHRDSWGRIDDLPVACSTAPTVAAVKAAGGAR